VTEPLTLTIDSAATPPAQNIARATAATLPQSFRLVSGGGDVVMIDGRGAWTERSLAAIASGAKAILVVDPSGASHENLTEVLDTEVPVILDTPWRHNGVVSRISPYFQKVDAHGGMLEARVTVPSSSLLRESITALAFTAQALLGAPIIGLEDVAARPDHLTVFGSTHDILIRLSAVTGPIPANAWFRLAGSNAMVTVTVPSSESGASGVGTFTDADAKITVPFAFESAHRSALALIARVLHQRLVPTDIADFRRVCPDGSRAVSSS